MWSELEGRDVPVALCFLLSTWLVVSSPGSKLTWLVLNLAAECLGTRRRGSACREGRSIPLRSPSAHAAGLSRGSLCCLHPPGSGASSMAGTHTPSRADAGQTDMCHTCGHVPRMGCHSDSMEETWSPVPAADTSVHGEANNTHVGHEVAVILDERDIYPYKYKVRRPLGTYQGPGQLGLR